mmetsp:Transcript_6250/g.22225  ORF Transcript_6250/g.22225 Transcript_6250/m.22225 type:complete len:256 (+) Transcript_6250:42-809(+)
MSSEAAAAAPPAPPAPPLAAARGSAIAPRNSSMYVLPSQMRPMASECAVIAFCTARSDGINTDVRSVSARPWCCMTASDQRRYSSRCGDDAMRSARMSSRRRKNVNGTASATGSTASTGVAASARSMTSVSLRCSAMMTALVCWPSAEALAAAAGVTFSSRSKGSNVSDSSSVNTMRPSVVAAENARPVGEKRTHVERISGRVLRELRSPRVTPGSVSSGAFSSSLPLTSASSTAPNAVMLLLLSLSSMPSSDLL